MIAVPYPTAMDEDGDDDWLHDSGPGQGGVTDPLTNVEYDRLASKYSDAGYREGITDGKLTTLQEGFDSSFFTSVPPSRRLGNMRGKAAALLAFHTLRSTPNLDELRDFVRDLNKVKRIDILSIDKEREEHERDEHADGGYELDGNEKRDMEGLENALDSLGGEEKGGKREEELLRELEMRLDGVEKKLKGAITTA